MNVRKAIKSDISSIVAMLSDDKLGRQRERYEDPLPESYYAAFEAINHDSHQELVVMESEDGQVIGTLQLSLIPYLTYQGRSRA